jgi:hypothetical protein
MQTEWRKFAVWDIVHVYRVHKEAGYRFKHNSVQSHFSADDENKLQKYHE